MRHAVITLLLSLFLTTTVLGSQPASALCEKANVEAYDQGRGTNVRGMIARFLVNNFGSSYQYRTIRSIDIWQNSNNHVELGWHYGAHFDNFYEVFRVWRNDGDYHQENLFNISPGSMYEFKIHDGDGNKYWSFVAAGNTLGNIYANFSTGSALTNSETHCEDNDNVYAHFSTLRDCGQAIPCDYGNFQNLQLFYDDNYRYNYSKDSDTEHHVREN